MLRRPAKLLLLLVGYAGSVFGQVSVTIKDAGVVPEGDAGAVAAMFDVTLDIPVAAGSQPPGIVTYLVDFTTRDGSASELDNDYVGSSGQLLFTAAGTQTIMVDITGDTKVEADETFFVDLTTDPDVILIDSEGQATIQNDDATQLSIDDVTVTEGDVGAVSNAVFNVSLSASSDFPVTVAASTRDGSATVADGDYQARLAVQLDFPPGTLTRTLTVPVNGDATVEADESFFVDLLRPGGATLADGEGEATIQNDDGTALSIDDVSVVEGDTGTVNAVFTVTLSTESALPVTVDAATRDGSATAADGDYQPLAGVQLAFPAGSLTQTLTVAVNGDTRVEANESFFVDLSGAVGATIDDSEGEAAVQNDDSTTVSIGDVSVAEGDTGTVDAVLTVTLSNESALPVTVDFATRDGTATIADGDYQAAAGTLTFDPNEISQTVSVAVNGDLTVEPGESFFVDLSSAAGATIADGEGEATIQNDDGTVLSIGDASVLEKDEGGRTAIVPVVLSAPSALLVTVDFATRDGSATLAGDDYRAQAGELRFAPGVTRRDLRILVIGDTAVEPDERFFIDLESPAGAGLGDAEGVVTIRNDDRAPGVLRLAAAPSVAEGAGSATITVERTGGASGEATVEFETADGTALAGEDYQSAAGTLRWGDGESGSRSFVVELLDDNIGEDDETVAIRLTNPSGAALGAADETELTIVDDDQAARLEALGETEINSKVGRQIELQALATREDGSPVQGAEVVWTVEGDATLVGEGSTRTDADGVATQLIELGGSPGPVTVTAQIGSTGQTVSFEIVVAGNLDELFDPLLNPAEASVAMALNEACLDAQQAFAELCDYLFGLDPADQRDLITELTPFEAGALADLLLRSPTVQLLNLRRHLVARRGGGGTGSQITLGIGGQSVPLDVLRMAFSGEAEVVQRMAARIDAAMFQQEEEEAAADSAPAVDAEGSRFSFFASGQVDVGDRPGSEREAGYDLDTLGLTIGLDYRVGPRFILGGALGYVDTETKTVRDGGGIDVRGYGLSGFATYFRDKLWLDGILSYSWTEYDFLRNIDLPQPFLGQSRLAARGQPEGSQIAVDVGAGYDTSFGATSLSGFGRLSYIDAELDAFTERGAGPFNLALRGQQIESLLFEAGLELAWVSSRSWGVLQPVLRASALHEFEDDSREIVAGFAADVGGNLFRLPTDRPDRDFFRLGTGLTATLARGRALYLLYETDLEREDLDLYRLSAGLRLEF